MNANDPPPPETTHGGSGDSDSVGRVSNDSAGGSDPHAETLDGNRRTLSDLSVPEVGREWIGRRLQKHKIVGLLGKGGMGVVFRATDDTLNRDVAIKVLPREIGDDPNARERFLSEAKASARINHNNVVSIYEVAQHGTLDFIAMELMTGGNVGEQIARSGPLPPDEATLAIFQACKGLVAAHETGLVHRDIKPDNLLRSGDGTIKLSDFGLAKAGGEGLISLTRTGQVVGTPSYMSPEQCRAEKVDCRSDIYSLGATYYTLLTGMVPYKDAGDLVQVMYSQCHGEVLDPRNVDRDIPECYAEIVCKAVQKAPEDRFQTAREMLDALVEVGAGMSDLLYGSRKSHPTLQTTVATSPHVDTQRRVPRRSAVVIGALLVAGALAWIAWSGTRSGRQQDPSDSASMAPGVTENTLTFGTTTALSGANADLGAEMVRGIRVCFDSINEAGGINGRTLRLVALDDGYEPDRALANMQTLFEDREVFGVIGNVGTPTSKVTVPYALENRRLFFAPMTGASIFRKDPPARYLYHYRAGYSDETEALIDYFVRHQEISPNRIAVLAQDDSYGDDGFRGVADALRKRGVKESEILRVGYARNTSDVEKAVATLQDRSADYDAVIMVATYKPASRFVQMMKAQDLSPRFAALSFVGSQSLSEEFRAVGAGEADGVIVSQVVPHYLSNASGVIRYRDALRKFQPEARPGFVSLEGFIAAECLAEGLRRVKGELTTESLVDALDRVKSLDLGIGPIIEFGPSRHQASDRVWGTMFNAQAELQELDLTRP